jgi:hypothetical protein
VIGKLVEPLIGTAVPVAQLAPQAIQLVAPVVLQLRFSGVPLATSRGPVDPLIVKLMTGAVARLQPVPTFLILSGLLQYK